MSDLIKDESKVGAMLRYMTGDVALALKEDLQSLYIDPTKDEEVCRQCAKWHWLLVKYSPDPVMVRKYISIIAYAYEYNVRLEDMNSWKKTMRIVMPEEFMYKMSKFTQVQQIAVMDDTHAQQRRDFYKDSRDSSEVLW